MLGEYPALSDEEIETIVAQIGQSSAPPSGASGPLRIEYLVI